MLIVQRFGVRILGAFLPLPPFFFAIAARLGQLGGCYGTELATADPSRRAQISAQTVGLLGDGTHAQAMAPALGARRRQAARGNRFVTARVFF